jgi:hypothetical protein
LKSSHLFHAIALGLRDERIAEQLGALLDAVGQKQAFEAKNGKGPALQQALVN